jgi:biotin synthase-related radical SAM superfamily protein
MEKDLTTIAKKKAALLAGGAVTVPESIRLPVRPSRSTAGPGAGSIGIVIAFQGHRVKKTIVKQGGDFELVEREGRFSLRRGGRTFLDEVEIQPTLFHAPQQAFFNIETQCIYGCKFCTSSKLEKQVTKNLTPDKIVGMIIEASKRPDFQAVALTSAVVENPKATVDKMIFIVRKVREALGDGIAIGVEPYVDDLHDIDRLREAGANEIKMNVESYDREIFRKVCGELDVDWVFQCLRHAVQVFGRGKVTSNLIVGLGETDQNVLEGVEALAEIGVVAGLRALRVNAINRGPLTEALGRIEPVSEERMLGLALAQKDILERHGLTTLTFETMCFSCTCCDIVPFRDI